MSVDVTVTSITNNVYFTKLSLSKLLTSSQNNAGG